MYWELVSLPGQISGSYIQYIGISRSSESVTNFVEAEYIWDGATTMREPPLKDQSLGIYFREVTEIRFDDGGRVINITAIGNNTPPVSQLNVAAFIANPTS